VPELPRVVVTGLGVVSPLGPLPAFWERLCAGATGIVPIDAFDPGPGAPRRGACVRDWEPKEHIPAAELRRMDRFSRLVVTACRTALADAALALDAPGAEATGLVFGTAFGNLSESEEFLRGLFAKGPARANPLTFPNLVLNAPTGYAAIDLGLRGPSFAITHGEASGEAALAAAYDTIVCGQTQVVLAGGGDELPHILFQVYKDLGVLSPHGTTRGGRRRVGRRAGAVPAEEGREWSSPFARARNGFVMGEGVAMLVLESGVHAHTRGARVYAELVGHASESVPSSPHDWPHPDGAPPVATARQLAALGWVPRAETSHDEGREARADLAISCANSTPHLDAYESSRLTRLLGDASARVLVTSLKGAIGDFGGAGALAAAAAVLALHNGRVPPLAALDEPDPDCTLRLATPGTASPAGGFAHALVSASPRGGGCLTLLFRRP